MSEMRSVPFSLTAVLLLAAAWSVNGQEMRGSINGRIVDVSGAAALGAKITAANKATNVATTASSNAEGSYVIPFLVPGQYSVAVELPGFTRMLRDVVLQTQERLTLDFTLQPGQVTDSVTVTAESPMLQTASADFGQVINTEFMERLPVMGANPLGLADMAPGVVPVAPDSNAMNYNSSYVQINGSSGRGNQMTIDGAPGDVPRNAGVSYIVPMAQMVAEMKVVTAMFDAAQGRTNGGAILLTTRAGTNAYHGSAYYHLRDERFNANSWTNNYLRVPRGMQNYGMVGGTLGGPIRRNRSFFMVGLEKERDTGNATFAFRIPTPAEKRGDFSQTLNNLSQPLPIYDPLSTVMDSNGRFVSRTPFPNARIPADRTNVTGAAILNAYPEANYFDFPNLLGQNNFVTTANHANPNVNLQSRFDHILNNSHRLFFRYARNAATITNWDRPVVPAYTSQNWDDRNANHYVLEDTATLGPALVASFRLGFNRYKQTNRGFGDTLDPAALKLPDILRNNLYSGGSSLTGWPRFQILDGNMPEFGPLFRQSVNNVLTFTNSFSRFWGRHNLRWGLDFRNTRWNENNPGDSQNSFFAFDKNLTRATDVSTSSTTSGSGMASLLLGYPTFGRIRRTPAMSVQSHYAGLYVQDDFRINPRLTLSVGLRFDVETPYTERYDQLVYRLDPDADLGITVPGVGPLKGGLRFVNTDGLSRRQGSVDKNNFGPRVGAAYTLNSKTVIRGGWGLFYEGLTNNSATPAASPTFNFATDYIGSGDGNRTVLPGVDLSNPFPNGFQPVTGSSLGVKSLLGSAVSFANPDLKMPSIHQIQVTLQRELPWRSILEAAYVGTRYNSLFADYELNEVPDAFRRDDFVTANPFYRVLPSNSTRGGAATITANLLKTRFPQFASAGQQRTNGPWGRYHGLQIRWEKRLTNGIQFVTNYTRAKNMYFDVQSLVNDRFYKSVTDTDRAHVARVFLSADVPFGRNRTWGSGWSRWLDSVAGGWAVSWVVRYRSGAALGLSGPIGRPIPLENPMTGASVHDCLGTPAGSMPEKPCLDISKVQVLTDRYAISSEPARYSWLRGPGYTDLDAVLFKDIRITEAVRFEFRAEANNVRNTPQWGNPSTNAAAPRTFGTISSGGNPRHIRLTGRIVF